MQYKLDLIPHAYGKEIIQQRAADGYVNATAMCKAANKLWGHYRENVTTKAFLEQLAVDIGIPISELVQSIKGGDHTMQGTWVHPQVAIHLAQWLSPKFAVMVSQWVFDWMKGKAPNGPKVLPFHLRRYVANQTHVPEGHFSILTEMVFALIGPLEAHGYRLPEKLWPDISQGLMFCKFLRDDHGIDTKALPTYTHVFEDGRPPVLAKAYPEDLLVTFRRYIREVWMPKRAAQYFAERDPVALKYLPKLLPPAKKAS